MFAKATKVGFAQQVVATLVASAVLMWSFGMYHTAQAANLTLISDTLGTSEPAVTSTHSIAFTIPTGSALADGDTVTITFPVGFTGVAAVADANTDITVGGTLDVDGSATVAGAGQSITFNTVAAAAGQEIIVAIDDLIITNPAVVGSYEISLDTGTGGDNGNTRVAIIDTVLVTAAVLTTFDFTIIGTATSTAVNGTSTTGSTTPTAVPFGTVSAGEVNTLAQRLTVSTNARNGFVVTVQSDGELESSNGAIIDSFTNGTDIAVAGTAWASPTNLVADEATWGHWGITYDDDATVDLAANEFIAASTTPREVFSHTAAADGVTPNIGSTTIGYQLEITPLQEAADDYSTILTFIATPTF